MSEFSPINGHISDLFFNYSHEGWELEHHFSYRSRSEPDASVLRASILADAREFADCVVGGFGLKFDPEALAADFWGRV